MGPGPMVVDRESRRGGYQICFNCGGFGHIAGDCRSRRQGVREGRRID